MYINITTTETGNNKGSSGGLVHYLEKENRQKLELEKPLQTERWFNAQRNDIRPHEVRRKIDGNISKLSRNDSKFFLINISPSKKEIAHLQALFGRDGAKEKLKEYAGKVMDKYARNFKRPGINSNRDLLWFGKLEKHRYYSYRDAEVKNGLKKRGERKEGEQMHVQVIVSRKDITNKIKISPQNTSKGRNARHSKKMGQFDRMAFKQSGETLFDEAFGFDRGLKETLAYANTLKNGSTAQKVQLHVLEKVQQANPQPLPLVQALGKDVSQGLFENVADLLESTSNEAGKLLNILLEPSYDQANVPDPIELAEKRRKKKEKGQGYHL